MNKNDTFYIDLSNALERAKIKCKHCNDTNKEVVSFYEMVSFLKENPTWTAKSNHKEYKYDTYGLVEVVDNEWLKDRTPNIMQELLDGEFELVSPAPKQEWININPSDILMMIVNDNISEKIRVRTYTKAFIDLSPTEIKMLTIKEILDFSWQELRSV